MDGGQPPGKNRHDGRMPRRKRLPATFSDLGKESARRHTSEVAEQNAAE